MGFVRYIGRWTMTALVVNTIIGGGIFGLPGELAKLLGRASPLAILAGAVATAIFMACFAEVASQFSEPGGTYLYARTAFGRFLSLQIAWMELLSVTVGLAALVSLFVDYVGALFPRPFNTGERALALAVLIAIPAIANWVGVKQGATLSNLTTVAKLAPLILLIALGVWRFLQNPELLLLFDVTKPGIATWGRAMVFVVFVFGGWEDCVLPSGEIDNSHKTIPFGLLAGLAVCALIYTLLQFITVATVGGESAAPLAHAAAVLIGSNGARFVSLAAMISIYGWLTGAMLWGPRLAYSLGAQGDFPAVFARLNPRFKTPGVAILFYACCGWALAASGTFAWLAAVGAGTMLILYAGTCAALLRFRKTGNDASAFRLPYGRTLAWTAIVVCIAMFTGLQRTELLSLLAIAAVAATNWFLVRHKREPLEQIEASERMRERSA